MCYPLGNHCTIIQRINNTTTIKPIGTTSRVNARGDRVMESKACRDHGVYDAFGTCVFFLLVLRLRLEIVKYEPRHCTFCTGVYRDTVLLVDIGANLFNMASSFICLSGPCRWQYNSRCGYCY